MKAYSTALAVAVFLLSLVLSTLLSKAQAEARPQAQVQSAMASTSQAIKDLHGDKKHPFKHVDSSFRKIPRSGPNPTQNKFNHS
ncbi:hypothetical protein AB3S75_003796 [Citrus x aurantiifolia]